MPKGTLCQVNSQFKIGIPPDTVYNILIDPANKRVFKNIEVFSITSFNLLVDIFPNSSYYSVGLMTPEELAEGQKI